MKTISFIVLLIGLQLHSHAQIQGDRTIKYVVSDFEIAFNQKDAKAVANFWSSDGDYITYSGDLLHGRQAIENYFQKTFLQFYQTAKNKLQAPTIRLLKPDVAAVDVKWEVTNGTTSDGKPLPNIKGIMVWTMMKENDRWLIKIMHNVSLP
ncbi:hypothetical protein GCM10027299_55820 [Larkinella ripae]